VTRKWVLNASPTILLAKIFRIGLVEDLCSEVIIPSGVAQEIQAGPDKDPAKKWLVQKGNIKAVSRIEPTVAAWDLGLGENHVLSWCYQNEDYEAILDDGLARKCALSLGIPMRGTLGVILLAKKEGYLDEIKPVIEELIKVGLRIDAKTVKTVLDWANEK
jgi:predicted nucleic acid-binding protein